MKHKTGIAIGLFVVVVVGVYFGLMMPRSSGNDVIARLAAQDDGRFQAQVAALGKLQSLEANRAQAMLVRAGEAAIPAIAAAMQRVLEQDAQLQGGDLTGVQITKMQLVNLLERIGGESANALLAAVSKESHQVEMLRDSHRDDERAHHFQVIDDPDSSEHQLRGALARLVYQQPDAGFAPAIRKRLHPEQSSRVRDLAYWVAARMGLTGIESSLREFLSTWSGRGPSPRHAMLALAELTPVVELEAFLANQSHLRESARNLTVLYGRFVQGDPAEKEALLGSLLQAQEPLLKLAALEYMLSEDRTDLLQRHGVILSFAGKARVASSYESLCAILGYELEIKDDVVAVHKR